MQIPRKKNIKSASDAKYWLKFNNRWLKHQAGFIGVSGRAL